MSWVAASILCGTLSSAKYARQSWNVAMRITGTGHLARRSYPGTHPDDTIRSSRIMSDPVLPPTFQRWMDELLPSPIPRESRATCHDCPMLDASEAGPDAPFHPATKCCPYHPELSNFQVAAILLDDSPEVAPARAVLDRRIDGRLAVSPLAVRPPPAYMTIYNASAGATPTAFGRTPALVCPFYIRDGGLCGSWRDRNSVRASWFCRYERGARGRAFWRLVHLLLKTLEDSLRLWCVAQVDPEVARTAFLFEADSPRGLDEFAVSGVASEPAYLMQWGKWAGMERTFFKKCAQPAAGLS